MSSCCFAYRLDVMSPCITMAQSRVRQRLQQGAYDKRLPAADHGTYVDLPMLLHRHHIKLEKMNIHMSHVFGSDRIRRSFCVAFQQVLYRSKLNLLYFHTNMVFLVTQHQVPRPRSTTSSSINLSFLESSSTRHRCMSARPLPSGSPPPSAVSSCECPP